MDGNRRASLAAFLALILTTGHARAEAERPGSFGGPDAVDNQIADDSGSVPSLIDANVMQPWVEWKDSFRERTGVSFGIDYNGLYLASNDSLGDSTAAGGIFRFFGSWDLIGRGSPDKGALVWKVEHRSAYGDPAPQDFGLGPLGYVGFIGAPWSDQGNRLTNLYWRQRFSDGSATAIGGYFDVTDYVDTFVGGSPWTGFSNLAFSTGSASMFLPNDATLGVAAAAMLSSNIYAIAGVTNAYADPTSPFSRSFSRLFDDGEHFATLELGWTRSQERIYLDNTHVTLWHVDDSAEAGADNGWGLAFSHVRYLDGKWMPFLRGGFAEDGGSLLQKSVSVGFLYQGTPGGDLFGVGLNWGQPNKTTFGPGLDDQYSAEAFYRFQITRHLAITPSLEYLDHPALDPQEGSSLVLGVRLRLAL